ncbi:tuberin-like [Ciona intestinalis]
MSENKEASSLRSRFKNLLSSHKTQASVDVADLQQTSNSVVSDDFWLAISSTNNPEERMKRLKEFERVLSNVQIDCDVIEKLWLETKDQLLPTMDLNVRSEYFMFLKTLITKQHRHLSMLRALLYAEVGKHVFTEKSDVENVMGIIYVLTEHGKNLFMLEEEIGPHLVQWMECMGSNALYIDMLCNVVKFNSSHLTEETIHGIVRSVCTSCTACSAVEQYECSLKVLEALITYKALPKQCTNDAINTLCHTLNIKECCDFSWNLMRNLMGTHLGYSCIQTLLEILQGDAKQETYPKIQSAIFFIGMGLWGSKCVKSLMYTPQSILPSFEYALKSHNLMLAFEVVLTCHRLVKKFGHELQVSAWDNMLNIIEKLLCILKGNKNTERVAPLKEKTHELLSIVENLCQIQAFTGSKERLNEIIEQQILHRPTESVINLLTYKMHLLSPSIENWIAKLKVLIDRFYSNDMDSAVRLQLLELEMNIVSNNFQQHEADLVEKVILPQFSNLADETNVQVIENSLQFLTRICLLCTSPQYFTLLSLLKKITENISPADPKVPKNTVLIAVASAVQGLIDIFLEKFHSSLASHSIEACEVLMQLIENYYEVENFSEQSYILWESRMKIFNTFFQIRVNNNFQARLSHVECFSSFIVCKRLQPAVVDDTDYVYLPLQRIIQICIQCMEHENYWPILQTVIANILVLLENEQIATCLSLDDIDSLMELLSNFVSSANRISALYNKPEKRADLQLISLNVLTKLTIFYNKVDVSRQRQMLRCFELGFATKCSKQCINAITLCMIEMKPDAMIRLLPSILLRLSQMSATVHLATAVLELLSFLSQLPHLYSDFVEDQYLSVFAIALHHANPSKFSLYIVSLAHNIVSMWFVKCRLSFRSGLVQFVTRNLQTVNRNNMDNPLQHSLIESSIDLMARYVFSNSLPVMEHSALKKTKLSKSQSSTWLLGNRLITITTGVPQQNDVMTSSDPDNYYNFSPSRRKMSVEAPGKLQSTSTSDVQLSRNRHKSSGATLRNSGNQLLPLYQSSGGTVATKRRKPVTERSTTWAEICVRRPSGNSCWMMQCNQFQLVEQTHDANPSLNSLTSEASPQLNGESLLPVSSPQLSRPRQRSRTLGSASSNTQSAAEKAKRKLANRLQTPAQSNNASGHAAQFKSTQSKADEKFSTPAFIFLQLFQTAAVADSMHLPLLLPDTAMIDRAVQVLDRITPYDIWSTGVVYVGEYQGSDGRAILSNEHGSTRYQAFLNTLGKLVCLEDCNMSHIYLGGLDQSGKEDGQFTYIWQENIMQMVFHVTTLMPNAGTDISCKQRHIGNDYVMIVYDDDTSQDYVPGCVVKGQFLSIEIIIRPKDTNFNQVELYYHKPELEAILQMTDKRIVSNDHLGMMVRQTALHANMAALAYRHKDKPGDCVSKPLSRLNQIKRIRSRAIQESGDTSSATNNPQYQIDEFSEYI